MKKLLLIAILMLALVFTVVACTTDPGTTETTVGETTAADVPAQTTAEPHAETTAATPADTTAEPAPADTTAEPVVTTEPEPETTADPMLPVNVFEAADITTVVGGDPNNLTQDCVTLVDGALHIVPIGPDPYYYPFAGVDGARYVAIRYKTDAAGADIQMYIGSTGAGPSNDDSMLRQPVIADGEWHLAIFDTQPIIDKGLYDGSYVSYFRFDALEAGYILNENGEPYKPDGLNYARYELPEGCSIDVEYIAFFHSEAAATLYDAAPIVIDDAASIAGKVAGAVKGSEVKTENGNTYVTLVSTADDPWFMLQSGLNKVGNYLAVSYRTNGTSKGEFFVGSGAGPQGGIDQAPCNWIGDEKWHLMVIDLAAVEGLTSITDGVVNYLRLDPFVDHVPEDQGRYIDIGFIALFESAADAEVYYSVVNCEPKDIKNTFVADVNANEIGTGLDASDLKNYFTIELPLGSEGVIANGEGKMYSMTAISDMYADVAGKYFIKANNLTAGNGFMFVRGYKVVNSDEIIEKFDPAAGFYKINNYYEMDGAGQMGGAGIYAAIENGTLTIMVKYYNAETVTRVGNKIYTLPVDGTELVMADNGDVVSIIVNGKLCATIALSGSVTYADINEVSPAGNFAASAVVTLADGTTETIENTLIADTCACQVGVVARGGHFKFDALEVGAFSAIEIPAFPEAPSNEIAVEVTDNYCWVDVVEFTATATGHYTFTLPAGLGAFDVDDCDAWPPVGGPYVDYYDNIEGATFTIGLTEGETTAFYVAHTVKGSYVITYEFTEGEVGGDEPSDDPAVPSDNVLNLGENTVVVTDADLVEGAIPYSFTVTEAGMYSFESNNLMAVIVIDAFTSWRGQAYLEPGTYTINVVVAYAGVAGEYGMNVVAVVEEAGNTVDFSTLAPLDESKNDNNYTDRESADGWKATGARIDNTSEDYPLPEGASVVMLNGKTSAIGTLTSPTLEGGIASISFSLGYFFTESSDISLTLKITGENGTEVVETVTVTAPEKLTEYTYEYTLETAIEGNFTIEIINNCPSQVNSNKDRVAIWNFTWASV